MKYAAERPYADPEKAAPKLVEIANSVEPVQDGRIFIELINWPFLHDLKGSPSRDRLAHQRVAFIARPSTTQARIGNVQCLGAA
jgi:hypothetical protein